jgi:hypothetical protein
MAAILDQEEIDALLDIAEDMVYTKSNELKLKHKLDKRVEYYKGMFSAYPDEQEEYIKIPKRLFDAWVDYMVDDIKRILKP